MQVEPLMLDSPKVRDHTKRDTGWFMPCAERRGSLPGCFQDEKQKVAKPRPATLNLSRYH